MSKPSRFRFLVALLALAILPLCIRAQTTSPSREIPGPLRGWEQWATWDDADRLCPTPYRDPDKPLCFWPSRLALSIEPTVGRFELEVTVYQRVMGAAAGGWNGLAIRGEGERGRAADRRAR